MQPVHVGMLKRNIIFRDAIQHLQPFYISKNMELTVQLVEKEYKKSEVRWILEQINALTDQRLTLKVSDVATQKRILPKGTPFPGPDRTGYH